MDHYILSIFLLKVSIYVDNMLFIKGFSLNKDVAVIISGNINKDIKVLIPDIFDGITPLFTKQRSRVTMNLEGVTGIDNSGIATIVECVRMASDSETEFNVIGINEKVKEVLELTKLSSLFENMEFRTVCSNSESGTLGCCIKKKINIPSKKCL